MWKQIVTLATAAAIAIGVAPAATAATPYLVETGTFKVAAEPGGSVSGTFEESLAFGTRATLGLTVRRSSTGPACVFVRTVFTHVNGTSTNDSGLDCANDAYTARTHTATSRPSDYLLSYTVKLVGMTSPTAATGSLLAQRYFVVGPDSDSSGRAYRLDRDHLTAAMPGATPFTGSTDYLVDYYVVGDVIPVSYLRSHVTGDLTWTDAFPGTRANAVITWTYTDGSSSAVISAPVTPSTGTIHVDAKSEVGKKVWSVKVDVTSDARGLSFGVQARTGTVKFGDHLAP